MTINEAKIIAEYVRTRELLISKIKEYENCTIICGEIGDGTNGLGFRWENGKSYEIKCLLDGLKVELERINQIIFGIEITNTTNTSESEVETE